MFPVVDCGCAGVIARLCDEKLVGTEVARGLVVDPSTDDGDVKFTTFDNVWAPDDNDPLPVVLSKDIVVWIAVLWVPDTTFVVGFED